MSTSPQPLPNQIVIDAVANQMLQVTSVHVNVSQQLIITTEDKVRLTLNESIENMERRKDWIAPAGVLLTLVATFTTTVFQNFILPKDTWQAIFIIAGVLSLWWLGKSLLALRKAKKVTDVVQEIKQGNMIEG